MAAAWAVLAIALVPTLYAWWQVKDYVQTRNDEHFNRELSAIDDVFSFYLNQRFVALADELRGNLRDGTLDGEGWTNFTKAAEWRPRYPGLLELGWVERNAEATNAPAFILRQLDSRIANSVHFKEMAIVPEHPYASALSNALAQGVAETAGYVSLVGDPGGPYSKAAVSFIPVPAVTNKTQRQHGAAGFLMMAINQDYRFSSMQPSLQKRGVAVELLRFDSDYRPHGRYDRVIPLNTASGRWLFRVTALPSFYRDAQLSLPAIVLGTGTGVSLLLFAVVWSQGRRRLEAELANAELKRRDEEIQKLNTVLQKRIAARTDELTATKGKLQEEVGQREEAEALQARFRAVAEATSDLVAMAELDGTVRFLNQAGRRMAGIPDNADIRQLNVADFYPAWVNEMFEKEAFPAAMRDGSWSGEVALRHRDGREIPVSMVGLILRKTDGTPQYMACVIRDITEQRRAKQELQKTLAQEKELSSLKSQFIAMVSHEIRTPLALILSSSEILDLYLDRLTLEKRKQHLSTIHDSVKRLADLMELVLLYSRAENENIEYAPTPVALGTLLQQFVDEVEAATEKRCPIKLDADELSATVEADPKLLRHVVTNLLGNAVRYSEAGKPIRFTVRREAGSAVLCVADEGLGIPEEDRKRLFTPFYRGKNVAHIRGTGLGLMVVQRCIERMSGSIDLKSTEGVGTTVTVRLPMFQNEGNQ